MGLAISENLSAFYTAATAVGLIAVYVLHWLQDYIKGVHLNGSRQGFFLDQAIHLVVLFALRLVVYNG